MNTTTPQPLQVDTHIDSVKFIVRGNILRLLLIYVEDHDLYIKVQDKYVATVAVKSNCSNKNLRNKHLFNYHIAINFKKDMNTFIEFYGLKSYNEEVDEYKYMMMKDFLNFLTRADEYFSINRIDVALDVNRAMKNIIAKRYNPQGGRKREMNEFIQVGVNKHKYEFDEEKELAPRLRREDIHHIERPYKKGETPKDQTAYYYNKESKEAKSLYWCEYIDGPLTRFEVKLVNENFRKKVDLDLKQFNRVNATVEQIMKGLDKYMIVYTNDRGKTLELEEEPLNFFSATTYTSRADAKRILDCDSTIELKFNRDKIYEYVEDLFTCDYYRTYI